MGRLDSIEVEWRNEYSVCVVACAEGYPDNAISGQAVMLADASYAPTFHSGTKRTDEGVVTSGGRVLAVVCTASSLSLAIDQAYQSIKRVSFNGMHCRTDIGAKGLDVCRKKTTYKDSGVDIHKADTFIELIKPAVRATRRPGCDAELGGFGGLFNLFALTLGTSTSLDDMVLVASTDGVGSKLIVAQKMGKHGSIGIDLVAMCVNDLIVQGAMPLFFLDYFACGKLNVEVAAKVVESVCRGCVDAGCALIGGETAEMPGMYEHGMYDVAGFAVGAVTRGEMLPKLSVMREGDVLIGVASSGVHSNGFSLVRKIVEMSGMSLDDPCPFGKGSLGDMLLIPTRIYISVLEGVVKSGLIKGMAHITGGGIVGNVPRCLPKELGAVIESDLIICHAVFKWLQSEGCIDTKMYETFNCGVGMVLVVGVDDVETVKEMLLEKDEVVNVIGYVKAVGKGEERVVFV